MGPLEGPLGPYTVPYALGPYRAPKVPLGPFIRPLGPYEGSYTLWPSRALRAPRPTGPYEVPTP